MTIRWEGEVSQETIINVYGRRVSLKEMVNTLGKEAFFLFTKKNSFLSDDMI